MDSVAFALSPFDHIMPRRYTFRLLFFPMAETQNATTIESTLRSGLSSMMEAMPILSGTLKPFSHPLQSGRLAITAPWNRITDIFQVKDLSRGISYEELRRRHFPMDAFEFEEVLSIAAERPDTFGLENPVILAQLNFVTGGFILGVCMHHSVLDGQAAVPLMEIWAAHCRGEGGGESARQLEWLSRAPLLRQAPCEAIMKDFYEYVCQSPNNEKPYPTKVGEDSEVNTDIFFFPSSALRELKILASPLEDIGSNLTWISTNDALVALCYCCITTARTPHPPEPLAEIQLAQTLDGRRLLHPSVPPEFLGNASLFCQIPSSFNSLQPSMANISTLALRIRQRIDEISTTYADNLLSVLGNVPDISAVEPSFAGGGHRGMMVSSWRQQTFGTVEWGSGVGARVERMRVPKMFGRYEGVCIVLPEEESGWEVMVGLYPEAMDRLKRDDLWRKFATWRCH